MSSQKQFGKLRGFIWPVHGFELKRFVPMLLVFFLISLNYNILRATKDTLVVTAPASGAETLPFLKVWVIVPIALLMTFLYTRLSNRLSREKVFYTLMGIFLGFFFIFAFFLYPNQDLLHPHQFADRLENSLPVGFHGMIAILRNWTFSLFYVMSEMWSAFMMTVLFWGFANDVTNIEQAKRFYGLLGISANFSGVVGGTIATSLSLIDYHPSLPFGHDAWSQSVVFLNSVVIFAGLISIVLFRWLHVKGYGYTTSAPLSEEKKMGIREMLRHVFTSKYLIAIALLVICYNISITLVEVVWKDQVKQLYPNPSEFNAYMGDVLKIMGTIATLTAIFITGNVIRRFGWKTSAMIPCHILLFTSAGFFTFLLLKNAGVGTIVALLGATPLAISVFFGTLHNCFSRASKYTLFDSTKEMAFIPLSQDQRIRGKAAIDGIGSRVGKSGASLAHQGLLLLFGTISASVPFVALILFGIILTWMFAVRYIGRQFQELSVSTVPSSAEST